jgi:aminoglycoside 6'-N-acetyltransferase I
LTAIVRRVCVADRAEWRRLREALWPDLPAQNHDAEMEGWLSNDEIAVFVAERSTGGLCGFLEAAIRPCTVNGELRRIGYIEGWYVDPDVRRKGLGRSLVNATEKWTRSLGLKEIHSDAHLKNHLSHVAHQRLGYAEVERLVHFRKKLT